jgi:hypothetical protein
MCENLELHLNNNGPWKMLKSRTNSYRKVILILEKLLVAMGLQSE